MAAKYLEPNSRLTLREGLSELRLLEGADDAVDNMAPELSDDIDSHDIIHVLFACETSIRDEVIAHIWTALGTDYGVDNMVRVNRHQDHREVLRRVGHLRLVKTWVFQVPRIALTIYRAHRMIRPFPISETPSYLDRRLGDIRTEFGIRLSVPDPHSTNRAGAALRSVNRRDSTVSA